VQLPCLPKVADTGIICLMDQVMGHADQRRSNSRVFAYVGVLLMSVDISVIKTRVEDQGQK
jgi:hypothetical protein